MMPITSAGYLALRGTDLIDLIRSEFESRLPSGYPAPDWGSDSHLGQLSASIGTVLGVVSQGSQQVFDAFNPDSATGVFLGSLTRFAGVNRRSATFSRLPVTITGDAGTTVPDGFRMRFGGYEWQTSLAYVVGSGGTVDVDSYAVVPGPITTPAGAEGEILTPETGLASVTSGSVILGRDRETDPELFVRWQESYLLRSGTTIGAIRASLAAIESVESVDVYENATTVATEYKGVALDPHSVAIIVHPLQDSEGESAIAEVLKDRVTAGVDTLGSESASVSAYEGGPTRAVRWSYPTEVDAVLTVRLIPDAGVSFAAIAGPGEDAIVAALEGLRVPGTDLTPLDVLAAAASVSGVRGATVQVLTTDPVNVDKIDGEGNLIIDGDEILGTVTLSVVS